jgi:hypothetical protein
MDLLVVPARNGSTTQIVVTDVQLSVERSDVLTRKVAGGAYGRPTGTGAYALVAALSELQRYDLRCVVYDLVRRSLSHQLRPLPAYGIHLLPSGRSIDDHATAPRNHSRTNDLIHPIMGTNRSIVVAVHSPRLRFNSPVGEDHQGSSVCSRPGRQNYPLTCWHASHDARQSPLGKAEAGRNPGAP